jgi:hypothetical protein
MAQHRYVMVQEIEPGEACLERIGQPCGRHTGGPGGVNRPKAGAGRNPREKSPLGGALPA